MTESGTLTACSENLTCESNQDEVQKEDVCANGQEVMMDDGEMGSARSVDRPCEDVVVEKSGVVTTDSDLHDDAEQGYAIGDTTEHVSSSTVDSQSNFGGKQRANPCEDVVPDVSNIPNESSKVPKSKDSKEKAGVFDTAPDLQDSDQLQQPESGTPEIDMLDEPKEGEPNCNDLGSDSKALPVCEDPGNIFVWRDELIEKRDMDTLDKCIEHEINFYCESYSQGEHVDILIRSQPVKFLAYSCIRATHLACSGEFDKAYSSVIQAKNFFRLYYEEIEDTYDLDGIFYFLNLTRKEIYERDTDEFKKPDLRLAVSEWNDLSEEAQSIVFAAQLYYYILVKEPVPVLNSLCQKVLSSGDNVPEWQLLQWEVLRRKRHESNLVIVKPKRTEMNALRKAFDLDPSNIAVRLAVAETMFDWMRTDDRAPQIELMGEYMRSVDDISFILHTEIQELFQESLPTSYEIEVNLIASGFYGYRNLSQIMYRVQDDDTIEGGNYIELEDGIYQVLVSREEATKVANDCLNFVLEADPKNTRANLMNAYRLLRMFQRDLAFHVLRCCKEIEPLNEAVVLAFVRTSVGGNSANQMEALQFINEALSGGFKWSALTTAHFYFIKGCLLWLSADLHGCVQSWVDGLYFNVNQFLSQFSFWTKTHIRKYLWPTSLANFAVVESLKEALRVYSTLPESQLPDARIPGACTAFLKELDEIFPLTTQNAMTIAKLSRRWFYLLDLDESYSDSSSEPEDEGPPRKVQIVDISSSPEAAKPQPVTAKHPTNSNLIQIVPQDSPRMNGRMPENMDPKSVTATPSLEEEKNGETYCTASSSKPSLAERPCGQAETEIIVIDDDEEDSDGTEVIVIDDTNAENATDSCEQLAESTQQTEKADGVRESVEDYENGSSEAETIEGSGDEATGGSWDGTTEESDVEIIEEKLTECAKETNDSTSIYLECVMSEALVQEVNKGDGVHTENISMTFSSQAKRNIPSIISNPPQNENACNNGSNAT